MGRSTRAIPSALRSALDAIDSPAFVLCADGSIERANAAGMSALEIRRAEVLHALAAWPDGPTAVFAIHEVHGPASAAPYLILTRGSFVASCIDACAARWELTAREREILTQVAAGLTNKQITAVVRLAEVTVENHLTRIFRKARVDSRAGVLAALLRAGEGFP